MESDSIWKPASRLVVYRNTPFGEDAWKAVGTSAGYEGRFHRRGEPLPLYASDSAYAALRELELQTASPLEPQREVLRRVTAVALVAGSRILIADHAETLEATGLTLDRVYDPDDYSACHQLAQYAGKLSGVVAISTQSNAERPQRTVAVLPKHAKRVTALVDYWEGSLNLLKRHFASNRPQPSVKGWIGMPWSVSCMPSS